MPQEAIFRKGDLEEVGEGMGVDLELIINLCFGRARLPPSFKRSQKTARQEPRPPSYCNRRILGETVVAAIHKPSSKELLRRRACVLV